MKPSGYVIYRGPSLIDSKPIVAIASTNSKNTKTGNMIQTYILVDNQTLPVQNYQSLADYSICGDCKHRRGLGGACYVNVGQGPTQVFKSYLKGNYPVDLNGAAMASKGRKIRIGTYGDPASVPVFVWESLIKYASGHTGYTHQWATTTNPIKHLCMASVDSVSELLEARSKGWRSFRVRDLSESVQPNEFICPASNEGNKRKLCQDCLACDGSDRKNKASPVIIAHGSLKSRFKVAA